MSIDTNGVDLVVGVFVVCIATAGAKQRLSQEAEHRCDIFGFACFPAFLFCCPSSVLYIKSHRYTWNRIAHRV